MQSNILNHLSNHYRTRSRSAGVVGAVLSGAICAVGSQRPYWGRVSLGAGVALAVGLIVDGDIRTAREARQESRDLWSLSGLAAQSERPLPPLGGWALTASAVRYVAQWAVQNKATRVVELGPGASTVALRKLMPPEIAMWGVEQDGDYAQTVRDLLAYHRVENHELIVAPIEDCLVEGKAFRWYQQAALAALPGSLDILIVDGPPNQLGDGSRYPALPLLRDRLKKGSLVVVDDTSRRDEWRMIADWTTRYGVSVVHRETRFTALEVLD